jgi:DNA polymerase-4
MTDTPAGTPPGVVLHVDLDAFFASVEQLDNPALRGHPIVVGGVPPGRGVVASCSYEARQYGIRSAMPAAEASRRCPHVVFVAPRMQRYAERSRRVMRVLRSFSPDVQPISIDEAFVDLSGTERLHGPPQEAAAALRARVAAELGLTITVGGATGRYVAKLASAAAKPDGLLIVPPGEESAFVATLRLEDLWGVGGSTVARLHAAGIHTVAALAERTPASLEATLGSGAARFLHLAARGREPGAGRLWPRRRSVSAERTFAADSADPTRLNRALLGLAHRVMQRMLEHSLSGRTVTIKYRHADFNTFSARRSLERPIASAAELYDVARALLYRRWNGTTPLRLLGCGVADVKASGYEQAELFARRYDRERQIEAALLDLRRRDKGINLRKATLLDRPAK